jgi:hypothetical protein
MGNGRAEKQCIVPEKRRWENGGALAISAGADLKSYNLSDALPPRDIGGV